MQTPARPDEVGEPNLQLVHRHPLRPTRLQPTQ